MCSVEVKSFQPPATWTRLPMSTGRAHWLFVRSACFMILSRLRVLLQLLWPSSWLRDQGARAYFEQIRNSRVELSFFYSARKCFRTVTVLVLGGWGNCIFSSICHANLVEDADLAYWSSVSFNIETGFEEESPRSLKPFVRCALW